MTRAVNESTFFLGITPPQHKNQALFFSCQTLNDAVCKNLPALALMACRPSSLNACPGCPRRTTPLTPASAPHSTQSPRRSRYLAQPPSADSLHRQPTPGPPPTRPPALDPRLASEPSPRTGAALPASPHLSPALPATASRSDRHRRPSHHRFSSQPVHPAFPTSPAPQAPCASAPAAALIPESLELIPPSPRGRTHPMHPRCRRFFRQK